MEIPGCNVRVLPSALEVADAAAAALMDDLRQALTRTERPAIVLSSGKTPLGIYALLRERYAKAIPWERIRLLQMDEYSGLEPDDPRLFRHFLRTNLVAPLGMQPTYLSGAESAADMLALDAGIRAAGGLDLVLFGVGTNGHLGFNEPGTPADASSRQVQLAASTQSAIAEDDAAAGAAHRPMPSRAVSMGLGLLLETRAIHLVALGPKKRAAIQRGLTLPPAVDSPVSWVQTRPQTQVFLDQVACPWVGAPERF
jgi:6-phosphogluconolactonase/glucosamine-6-phosphate isomerase/deaminase